MGRPLAVDRVGNAFWALHPPEMLGRLEPISYAVVVARHRGRTLLVFNTYRQHWEAPGGVVDPGETLEACAARELNEESGQAAPALHLEGIMEHTDPKGQRLYGAVYRTELAELHPFEPNAEISAVALWDGAEEIGYVGEMDAKLLEMV